MNRYPLVPTCYCEPLHAGGTKLSTLKLDERQFSPGDEFSSAWQIPVMAALFSALHSALVGSTDILRDTCTAVEPVERTPTIEPTTEEFIIPDKDIGIADEVGV